MKPIYYPKIKTVQKTVVVFVATLVISSFFTSCTVDEIQTESKARINLLPKNDLINDVYLQRNDTIRNDSIPTNTSTNSSSTTPIDPPPPPPIKGNNPPPPPNP